MTKLGKSMELEQIQSLVENELQQVQTLLDSHLHSKISLINELCHHIIDSGGKRLRPLLLLLAAKSQGYTGDQNIKLAVAIEFTHTATLLHDDVVDESHMRRGQKTANTVWSSKASVLVGDYLFTKAFQDFVKCQNLDVLATVSNAINLMTQGEVLQLVNCYDPKIDETVYMEIIRSKTAILFSAAAKIGAIISTDDKKLWDAFADYALHLGNAFQLIDDALDYSASSDMIGKNIGDDFAEGKPTLPLIYAYNNSNPKRQKIIRDAMTSANLDYLDPVLDAIKMTKAIDYTYETAQNEIDLALTALQAVPASEYRDALAALANFTVQRKC